ncbi:hypothetical protein KI688_006589 [Linnemannia hyalina]|uniref:Integrase SAM-like N-terminal domain-containing protein n=1 Tax=Linnemannia hyalina TaxID=64524 RepID=A0A9P7XKI4_9FUNG|nr:hypothetical protein KI688_006589 [Linnemannia hyalina]
MTWKPSPGAIGHDALQHNWQSLGNIYICLPWNLLPLILQKLQQEQITATSRKRPRHTGQEPSPVPDSMANKRRRLEDKGWDEATASLVLDNPREQRKQERYSNIQERYISWVKNRGFDPQQPNPAQLLNWLTAGVLVQNWQASTVNNYKAAIIYMYDDKTPFLDPDFLSYFKAIQERTIKDMKEIDIDLRPILDFFRQQGPNETLGISILTKKPKFELTEVSCKIPVFFPKETRGGQQIIKYPAIRSHDDPLLCPVRAIAEYLRRLEGHEIMVPHHKNKEFLYRPLIRDVRFPKTPVINQTISNHITEITDMLNLPKDETRPKARAIGPTAAIKKGARVDDVVVHGNWSSDVIVNNYYRLSRATATNFTSLVLS